MFGKKKSQASQSDPGGQTPGIVLDEAAQRNLKAKRPLARDAVIAVDRNRWFLIAVIMACIALYALYSANVANERYERNVRVQWVKMYPNGTWDIEFYDESRAQEFFPATIDALLTQFVERRFSKQRMTIKYDYGFATQFLSQDLEKEFLDPNRGNAAQIAAQVEQCSDCNQTVIKVRNIDHYDAEKIKLGATEGALYRTNIFVREVTLNKQGDVVKEANKIISLAWRIREKNEVNVTKEVLVLNPIGLEITKADYLEDPSPTK